MFELQYGFLMELDLFTLWAKTFAKLRCCKIKSLSLGLQQSSTKSTAILMEAAECIKEWKEQLKYIIGYRNVVCSQHIQWKCILCLCDLP